MGTKIATIHYLWKYYDKKGLHSMKKSILLSIAAALITVGANAQSYAHYYKNLPVEIEQVKDVIIPDHRVNVVDFGAVADGETLCTEAFAKAVKYLSQNGGGHLDVPGGTYLTGPIQLKSNIDLHLIDGATILFSTDKTLFIPKKGSNALAGVYASKAQNVCISGNGTLDGQGQYWRPVKKSKVSASEWEELLAMGGTLNKKGDIWMPYNLNNGIPSIGGSAEKQEDMRNHLVQFTDCQNVMVKGVKLFNSPKFHLVPTRCKNLIVDGITVECPWNAQNGDAIDPGNVQTALIVGCTISCGDDGICMKGGIAEKGVQAGPNSDFLIQDNTVYRAHGGFVIGSEFSGGMHRLIVRNCHFQGTDIGLRFKSAPGRGGTCSDIYCYDITMKDIVDEAILFQTSYADKGAVMSATAGDDKSSFFPDFCNFTIRNVKVDGAHTAMFIEGIEGYPVHDITLENVVFKNCVKGLDLKHAQNINLIKTRIESEKGDTIDKESVSLHIKK